MHLPQAHSRGVHCEGGGSNADEDLCGRRAEVSGAQLCRSCLFAQCACPALFPFLPAFWWPGLLHSWRMQSHVVCCRRLLWIAPPLWI